MSLSRVVPDPSAPDYGGTSPSRAPRRGGTQRVIRPIGRRLSSLGGSRHDGLVEGLVERGLQLRFLLVRQRRLQHPGLVGF